jgi:4-hydroxybenzoate polyprenyltransferase and related prenyltransferases
MAIIGTFISSLVALGSHLLSNLVLASIASLCVFLVLSGGNILNDVLDVEGDKINHPQRPIPSGKISERSATYIFLSCFVLAIIIAAIFLPLSGTVIVGAAILLLIYYETRGKYLGLPGNLTVSALIGLIFLFGGVIFGFPQKTIILFFLAMFANASRELIKDVQDYDGDVDRKTFPRTHGKVSALNLSSAFIGITVVFSVLPYIFHIFPLPYLFVVFVCDACFIATLRMQYKSAKKGQQLSRLSMIIGLLAFAVGGIA